MAYTERTFVIDTSLGFTEIVMWLLLELCTGRTFVTETSLGFAEIEERFSIAFTTNGKRQAEISRLPKTREIYLVSGYILPVSHSYGASTKNREMG